MKLHWHGMVCPQCKSAHQLMVSFIGLAKLTVDGSKDDGSHEWDDDSRTFCGNCGFEGAAGMFNFGEEGEEVDLQEDDEIDFDLQVYAMHCGEEEDTLCSSHLSQVMPDYFDIALRRTNHRTGTVETIRAWDDLPMGRAQELWPELEKRYGMEAEFI